MHSNYSYVSGPSSKPLLGETIGQNLKRTVDQFPQRVALVSVQQKVRLTYQELWDKTTMVAKALLSKGLKTGDRLGVWSANRYEWVVLQYATSRLGVILVNLNPAYRKKELLYTINQSEIKFLVSALKFKTSDYQQMVLKIKTKAPSLKETVFFDFDWEFFVNENQHTSDQDLAMVESKIQFDDPINLQYTSGTTGFPKGVTLSHHNILNNGYFIGDRLHYTEQDVVCIPVPFFHCFGMVIGNIAVTTHGATIVIPSESFDASMTLQAVEQEKCTSLYGVPTMFIAALQLPNFESFDLTSLRTGVMAGSICPVEIMKQVQSKMYMKEISICYGMTETSPVSTQTIIGVSLEKQVNTVGTVQDHLELKIIDPNTGQIVPRGVAGELCTRGYSVMLKYWGQPEATAAVIDEARWMHTGDLAVMDADDFITITGRIKDIIIRGGENISPKEIEEFLYAHENVQDVQVIGVPDPKYGDAIMAWVIPMSNSNLSEKELMQFCKDQIAHYKVPKYWKFVDSFPMTLSGKVRKIELKQMAIEELNL